MAPPKQPPKQDSMAVVVPPTADPAQLSLVPDMDSASLRADAAEHGMHFNRDELATPFLRVLQKTHEQVNPRHAKYVEGAAPGMFINMLTNRLYDGDVGILVLPVAYTPSYIEWIPLNRGGGLVRDYGADATAYEKAPFVNDKGKRFTSKDPLTQNELVKTFLYYVLVLDPDTGLYESAVLVLGGTQVKKGKKWNSAMADAKERDAQGVYNPAAFYRAYRLTTVFESNAQGDWMGVQVEPGPRMVYFDLKAQAMATELPPHGPAFYRAAQQFSQLIKAGKVKLQDLGGDTIEGDALEVVDEGNPGTTGEGVPY